jgi:hypothetical protein
MGFASIGVFHGLVAANGRHGVPVSVHRPSTQVSRAVHWALSAHAARPARGATQLSTRAPPAHERTPSLAQV